MPQNPLQRRLIRLSSAINRKAERLGAPGRVSAELLYLIALDHPTCPYCGIGVDPGHGSYDHIVSFDKGGTNYRDNITFGCVSCNRAKYTKTPEEHMKYQELEKVCPIDGTIFRPRYADIQRGYGEYCSRRCSAQSRWATS